MEVRFKLTLTVLSFDDFGKKSLTYQDVFFALSEKVVRNDYELSHRLVLPNDELRLSFTLSK